MTYHVLIKQERRISTPLSPRRIATAYKSQLHDFCDVINDWSNIDYAAEWDGRSPWIVVSKGAIADLKMAYMGWPMMTQLEWLSAHAVADVPPD